jgi:hypothetical protein
VPCAQRARGCGKTTVIATKPVVRFNVVKFNDFKDVIIPFFNKFSLYGNKRLDYNCFVKVFMLVKTKGHLTPEGLSQIKEIKAPPPGEGVPCALRARGWYEY